MNAPACPRCTDHRTATFHVAEMDCAHEVAILEKRVGTLDGVVTLDADVLSRQLRVHYDGATLSAAGIAEAVAQAGMRAWPVTARGDAPRAETGMPWGLLAAGLACVVAGALWLTGMRDLWVRAALLLAVALTAPGTLRRAWQAARGRRLDIHVLMTVAVAGALAIDEWFEAATVLVLFGVAQALEARSLARARRAIADVLDVTPPTADILQRRNHADGARRAGRRRPGRVGAPRWPRAARRHRRGRRERGEPGAGDRRGRARAQDSRRCRLRRFRQRRGAARRSK